MTETPTLQVAQWLESSSIYGPGNRFVLWLQGCSLRCPGCWNQEMWSTDGGQCWSIDDLAELVLSFGGSEGVTVMGGEPLDQAASLIPFLHLIRAAGRSVVLYTGYDVDELTETGRICYGQSDIVVAGRYVVSLRDTGSAWRGSKNQQIHFPTGRYHDFGNAAAGSTEILVDASGQVSLAGYPSNDLLALVRSICS